MLGGQRVREQRFYVLNGDPPRTWEQLVAVLDRRLRAEPRPRVIEIVIYRDSVDKDTEAVQRLIDWAKEHGLTVAPLFPPEDIPRGL